MPTEPPTRPSNPGSDAAIAAGCTCPVLDNARGRGFMGLGTLFVYTLGCPVHDHEIDQKEDYAE